MPTKQETEIARREPTDPWSEFDRLFDDLRGRLYGSLGMAPYAGSFADRPTGQYLRAAPTDITDTGTAFHVVAEIPGIPKEKLEVRILGSAVEIRGEADVDTDRSKGNVVHRERTYQGFYRALELPEPVVAKEAKASITNGVLELDLPQERPTPSPEPVKVPIA